MRFHITHFLTHSLPPSLTRSLPPSLPPSLAIGNGSDEALEKREKAGGEHGAEDAYLQEVGERRRGEEDEYGLSACIKEQV